MKEPRRTLMEMDVSYSRGMNIRAVSMIVMILLSLLSLLLYFTQSSEPLPSSSAVETNHLIVRSLGDGNSVTEELASGLEADYASLLEKLQVQRTAKVFVDIYPSMAKFNKALGVPSLEFPSVPAVLSENRLSIVLPDGSNTDYDLASLKRVIKHQLTHFIVQHIQTSPDIRWLNESIALYYGGQKSKPDEIGFVSAKGYPTIDELNADRFADLYSVGYTLSEFIIDKWGEENLVELLAFNGNIQQVLKISKEDFEREWQKFIEQKYVK